MINRITLDSFIHNAHLGDWTAHAPLESDYFKSDTIKILISSETLSAAHVDLVNKILVKLPQLLPSIFEAVCNADSDIDLGKFKDEIIDPTIFISEELHEEDDLWDFTVDRPSKWSTYGYHVAFRGFEIAEAYGAG